MQYWVLLMVYRLCVRLVLSNEFLAFYLIFLSIHVHLVMHYYQVAIDFHAFQFFSQLLIHRSSHLKPLNHVVNWTKFFLLYFPRYVFFFHVFLCATLIFDILILHYHRVVQQLFFFFYLLVLLLLRSLPRLPPCYCCYCYLLWLNHFF